MHSEFLFPDEARELLEWRDRRNAKLPELADLYARLFPAVSDEIFRYVMEKALLGELRQRPLLPPLDNSPRSPADPHQ
jgi:hypothetical protein